TDLGRRRLVDVAPDRLRPGAGGTRRAQGPGAGHGQPLPRHDVHPEPGDAAVPVARRARSGAGSADQRRGRDLATARRVALLPPQEDGAARGRAEESGPRGSDPARSREARGLETDPARRWLVAVGADPAPLERARARPPLGPQTALGKTGPARDVGRTAATLEEPACSNTSTKPPRTSALSLRAAITRPRPPSRPRSAAPKTPVRSGFSAVSDRPSAISAVASSRRGSPGSSIPWACSIARMPSASSRTSSTSSIPPRWSRDREVPGPTPATR